jgi:hypothetical protein
MIADFGDALRAMREAAGLSLQALAARAAVNKPHLGHLEDGARRPTPATAAAVDKALHAGGVLIELAACDRKGGDDVRRRALLATLGAAASVGALAGPHALGDLVRHGLLDAAGTGEDWDAAIADAGHRLVTDPSPLLGFAMLTNLMILRQQLAAHSRPDLFRAAANLGQVYGLWLGNQAQLGGAHHWYRSSATLADRSGDSETRAWVRGRSAARGIYEGWTVAQTLATADAALAVTDRPTAGAVEAHAARVHVHALTGDIAAGRASVAAMADIAENVHDPAAPDPGARTAFLSAYLEARAGDPDSAAVAADEAETALAGLPMWLAEARVYRARAMVAAGDIDEGLNHALDVVAQLEHAVRVIGVAVRDVLSVLPAGHRSFEADELRRFADSHPGPWETLR